MSGYITVLLHKSNPAGDWGFQMRPVTPAAHVVITQIDPSCVAAELLEPGDRIVEIEGKETSELSLQELQSLLGNPSKRLSMVVLKRQLPKGGNRSVRKTTTEQVSTVEETHEQVERKKEYEVLLEVDPTESIDDAIKSIKGKIERGEELDAKELQITSSFNKNVQKNTSMVDSTKHTIQRDYGQRQQLQMSNQPRTSEILKRKEKYMREQKKEEMVKCERIKQEKQTMEEKKTKASCFWTEPPSDLKNAIRSNQYWKPSGYSSSDYISTSRIFNNLNDLHNTQRKTSAREDKRQFWENCRKKYGWDPPGAKYNVSHRPDSRPDADGRSKSCEPEHLDSQNPFNQEDYRQTNPFFTPSPTNPFYAECSSKENSQENISRTGCSEGVKRELPSTETPLTNEASRDDFTSKCEFFERATSVPTTSCVKNAQDIVSKRLGSSEQSLLKKPSEFISKIKTETRSPVESEEPTEVPRTSETETTGNTLSEHKAFLGQSVLRQSVTGSTSTSSSPFRQNDLAREQFCKSQLNDKTCKVSALQETKVSSNTSAQYEESVTSGVKECERSIKAPLQAQSMESEIRNHPLVIAAQQKELATSQKWKSVDDEAVLMDTSKSKSISELHSEAHLSVNEMEAQMKESIDRIRAESEKLCSLDCMGSDPTEPQTGIILPDSTGFPGLCGQKRSFTETSYEKVTRTGTPYENVESAWKRELRVATPSGFYDNGQEEVFRQVSRSEALRHQDTVLRVISKWEPSLAYSCEYMGEGRSRGGNGSLIQAGSK